VPSASSINLTNSTGNRVHITGTAAIAAVTLAPGARRSVVFDTEIQLIHGPNLLCPGGRSIATRPGDRALLVGDQSGVVYVDAYVRADGEPFLADPIMYRTQRVVDANRSLPSGQNALSAGPITIADSITVTVQDHATWSIA
jgi:hypothetical protein